MTPLKGLCKTLAPHLSHHERRKSMSKFSKHVFKTREVFYCPRCGWESFAEEDYEQPCPQENCNGRLNQIREEEYEV